MDGEKMTPQEETIRIAKELYKSQWTSIVPPDEYEELDYDDQLQWECVSKHVQRMIIEARIEQAIESRLENWDIEPRDLNDKEEGFIKGAKSAINNHQNWTDNRIKELQKQLEELK